MLWFERRWLLEEDIGKGFLSPKHLNLATLFIILFLSVCFLFSPSNPNVFVSLTLAVILGRLLALDLAYLVLPDVYTLPLIVTGLFVPPLLGLHSWSYSFIGAAIGFVFPLVFALAVEKLSKSNSGMGGGDIKLLAAMGGWLGPLYLMFSLPLACFLTLAFAIRIPKNQDLPFGPGLIISFIAFLAFSEHILTLIQPLFPLIKTP